jgi:hypothetical protein
LRILATTISTHANDVVLRGEIIRLLLEEKRKARETAERLQCLVHTGSKDGRASGPI